MKCSLSCRSRVLWVMTNQEFLTEGVRRTTDAFSQLRALDPNRLWRDRAPSAVQYKSTTKSIGEIDPEYAPRRCVEGRSLRRRACAHTGQYRGAGPDPSVVGKFMTRGLSATFLMLQSDVHAKIGKDWRSECSPRGRVGSTFQPLHHQFGVAHGVGRSPILLGRYEPLSRPRQPRVIVIAPNTGVTSFPPRSLRGV